MAPYQQLHAELTAKRHTPSALQGVMQLCSAVLGECMMVASCHLLLEAVQLEAWTRLLLVNAVWRCMHARACTRTCVLHR